MCSLCDGSIDDEIAGAIIKGNSLVLHKACRDLCVDSEGRTRSIEEMLVILKNTYNVPNEVISSVKSALNL